MKSDLKSDLKNRGKRRGKEDTLKNNHPEKDKIRGTLVRLLWRTAAAGLKPLRLPHACCYGVALSVPGSIRVCVYRRVSV